MLYGDTEIIMHSKKKSIDNTRSKNKKKLNYMRNQLLLNNSGDNTKFPTSPGISTTYLNTESKATTQNMQELKISAILNTGRNIFS